jgi:hypothetical protein
MVVWTEKNNSKRSPKIQLSVLEACPETKGDSQNCQKKYYEKLYEEQGSEAAFANLRSAYEQSTSIQANCHQLTHAIGRAAALHFSDVASAYGQGDNFCWSGYYHGVMEGLLKKLGDVNVEDQLNTICESVKKQGQYSFNHYNCAHGLGHGIMLIEGDDLLVSLKVCDKIIDSWERESCYSGVFMENIMAHINPDHSTKYIKDDDPLYPCTAVEEKYTQQCYMMQTSQSLRVLNNDYQKVFALCGTLSPNNQTTCYQSLGRDISGNSTSNPDKTHELCLLGPNKQAQENCVIGAVKDFISYHHDDKEAGKLCAKFEGDLQNTCVLTKQAYYQNF